MDTSVHEQTDTQREMASVAPVDSDSFIDTVLDVAQERADEAMQRSAPEQVDSDLSVIDLTTPEDGPIGLVSRRVVPVAPPVVPGDRDRRPSSNDGGYRGRQRRRVERGAMSQLPAAPAPVKIVEYAAPSAPRKDRGGRILNWRRIRRAWREWRISRTPRHRHTLGQRLQYRWWRHQDRLQRRRAQGFAPRYELLARLLRRAVVLGAVAVGVYLVVFAR